MNEQLSLFDDYQDNGTKLKPRPKNEPILNDFFSENQIIFASINTYELKNTKYIEIKNKIFESNQVSLNLE